MNIQMLPDVLGGHLGTGELRGESWQKICSYLQEFSLSVRHDTVKPIFFFEILKREQRRAVSRSDGEP